MGMVPDAQVDPGRDVVDSGGRVKVNWESTA